MSLLDDIITAITETEQKTSSILRKCLVLAYKIKSHELKSWAWRELNGYDRDDPDLPEYRRLTVESQGLFVGPLGQSIDNQPLPPAVLQPEHRHLAEEVQLVQPIAAYEDAKASDELQIPWPANMTLFYQRKFYLNSDLALSRAWQAIPGSLVVGVTDTVRTRVLKFVLELKEQIEEEDVLVEQISPAIVQTLVQMTIIGGNNVIGNVEKFVPQTVQVGDAASLRAALVALGIDYSELDTLQNDIEADQQNASESESLGSQTLSWIERNAKTAAKGAVKIGSDVATVIMTEAIKRYLGL